MAALPRRRHFFVLGGIAIGTWADAESDRSGKVID